MAKEKAPVASAAPAEDRKRAIEAAMGQIEKMYGKGSIMRLGDQNNLQVDVIPTGSLSLDVALGVGGLPRGRIVEIYGPESSGKTTLALHVAAEAQKKGGEVAFVDAEHALDPTYARALGVNIDEMLISQPDTGEQALEITEALVRSGAIDVIVVDSVAALVPRAEIEGEMGDSYVGLHARLMSQALRKLTGAVVRHCGDMGYGPRRAREKLREKGVPQELWDEALDELPPDGEQIDRFLQSKLHGRSPEDKEKKRLTDALLRRGFSWGEVRSAWGRYGSEIWEE